MTRIERIETELRELKAQQRRNIQRADMRAVARVDSQIRRKQEQLAEAQSYLPRKVSDLLTHEQVKKLNIVPKLLEMILAADYLADCAMELEQTLDKAGLKNANSIMKVGEITKNAQKLADAMAIVDNGSMADFICDNDQLIWDMHLLVRRYINQRITLE